MVIILPVSISELRFLSLIALHCSAHESVPDLQPVGRFNLRIEILVIDRSAFADSLRRRVYRFNLRIEILVIDSSVAMLHPISICVFQSQN